MIVSIPNGIGILHFLCCVWLRLFLVSIPNGIGILPCADFEILQQRLFQFPTGLEFYTASVRATASSAARFNSQRDGILHYPLRAYPFLILVSIPNGMEFYALSSPFALWFLLFQFPTGWNSTFKVSFLYRTKLVSIPNGMEFYSELNKKRRALILFQFPTGWNSTGALRAFAAAADAFQFPTGWNSTLQKSATCKGFQSFNSQRDGILHDID